MFDESITLGRLLWVLNEECNMKIRFEGEYRFFFKGAVKHFKMMYDIDNGNTGYYMERHDVLKLIFLSSGEMQIEISKKLNSYNDDRDPITFEGILKFITIFDKNKKRKIEIVEKGYSSLVDVVNLENFNLDGFLKNISYIPTIKGIDFDRWKRTIVFTVRKFPYLYHSRLSVR